jgi:apolipoprotein N-acyltransferase
MRLPSRPTLITGAEALGAGVLVALSMPPWGWWPLAFVGLAAWEWLLDGQPRKNRWRRTWLFSAGWLGPAMAWMFFLTAPGFPVAVAIFACYHATAVALIPGAPDGAPSGRDPWRWLALPAALTAAECLRLSFPFGGVPLATLAISQVSGPLAGLARVGGTILITFVTALIGTNLRRVWEFVRSRPPLRMARATVAAMSIVPAVLLLAYVAPRGDGTGSFADVTLIQGGGEQGTRAIDSDPAVVFDRHVAETAKFAADTDLVVWPENVIDIQTFAGSWMYDDVAEQAARLGVPLLVGITEHTPDDKHFLNAQVVVQPDGSITSRFDKVKRVPFGEYMPLRGLIQALGAPTNLVPRDAISGHGPAVLETPVGEVGVMISWEVFFGGRGRDAARHGARFLINPTNGSSYTGTILQTQQVASSRLRAIETGRWVAQVSPTGFSAFISPSGHVYDRTGQREAATLQRPVELRTGQTWYTTLGDKPFVLLTLVLWAVPGVVPVLRRRRPAGLRSASASDLDDDRDRPVVDQLDVHLRTEAAGGDGGSA